MGALILDGASVLLVERGREPNLGYWSIPGGVLEVGESLVSAVEREVREETGLIVKAESILEVFERILYDAGGKVEYHYVLIDYLCRPLGGTLLAGDDASRAAWVDRRDLPALRLTEGTMAVIEKAFERK